MYFIFIGSFSPPCSVWKYRTAGCICCLLSLLALIFLCILKSNGKKKKALSSKYCTWVMDIHVINSYIISFDHFSSIPCNLSSQTNCNISNLEKTLSIYYLKCYPIWENHLHLSNLFLKNVLLCLSWLEAMNKPYSVWVIIFVFCI